MNKAADHLISRLGHSLLGAGVDGGGVADQGIPNSEGHQPPAEQGGFAPAGIAVQADDGPEALRRGVVGGREQGHLVQLQVNPFRKNLLRQSSSETLSPSRSLTTNR